MDFSKSNFLWIKDWNKRDKGEPVVAYFKKKFVAGEKIKVSANSRYKLYINGEFLCEGPQKGSKEAAFVDTVDISRYVLEAENEILVKVLYYPEAASKRNDSLYYSPFPTLYIKDLSEGGELNGGADGWQARLAEEIQIVGETYFPAPIHGCEIVNAISQEEDWQEAVCYSFFDSKKAVAPFNLVERNIPFMAHEQVKFKGVVCIREGKDGEEAISQWREMLAGRTRVEIPENTILNIEIDAGELQCGYPTLRLMGGVGSRINITYAESYGVPQSQRMTPMGLQDQAPIKGDRMDYINGQLIGSSDSYYVAGQGDETHPEEYTPYLYRAFRFIRLNIQTADRPLIISSYDYLSTGYPLEVKNHPISSNELYNRIWDISLRTLKRCMHETYIDCPFYERLQYIMDTRAEILFTYELSGDDRLARAAMEAFAKTARFDGMLQASAPAEGVNVIPGFNMFFILMLHDHMTYFHDKALVRRYVKTIDGIIGYFSNHMTKKGLVGKVGGKLFEHRYWSFVDWCPQWDESIGTVPAEGNAISDESVTVESLYFLYGLKKAAELVKYIGLDMLAKEYMEKAANLKESILANCVDSQGFFTDRPHGTNISTHCQVWAVLNDLVGNDKGREIIEKTFGNPKVPQCSVSMSFYLMEAMDKLGILREHDEVWQPWEKMLENNMTTCVENFTDQRSDCHAWGSIMLYALPHYYKELIINE